MLFLRFVFSPDLFVYLFLWNGKASGYRRFSSFPLFVSLFLCSSCTITLIISTVKRRVLIILWRFCERYEPCKMVKKDALLVYLQRRLFLLFYRATALQRGNSFPSCAWRNILFRTRFSWFDHIFTTNSWKNIFVWFSYYSSSLLLSDFRHTCYFLLFSLPLWENNFKHKAINEQISNFAQTYPTNLKASSNEALLFMRRYRFANCSCFSCCFKDAYPSSNVQ